MYTKRKKLDLRDKHGYASIPLASSDKETSFECNQKLLMEEFGKPKPKYDETDDMHISNAS